MGQDRRAARWELCRRRRWDPNDLDDCYLVRLVRSDGKNKKAAKRRPERRKRKMEEALGLDRSVVELQRGLREREVCLGCCKRQECGIQSDYLTNWI